MTASDPIPEATAPAAEAGTEDTTDPGTPPPAADGTVAGGRTADGTAEQSGSALQPVHGRADLPAPLQLVSGSAVVGAADAVPAAPVRPAAALLPQQLGGHAFALAQSVADAPGGTSTITVTVAPDDLGPITIRASFAPDGTRLEFFSSTDGGREALKQAMPDLRREASSSGLSASLDLGTGTPEDRRDGRREEPSGHAATAVSRPVQGTAWTPSPAAGSSTLDLFA
ncbi:flagellar hook-length control protein FliK [Arthrobacter sp. TMS1-12-1]